MSKFSDLNKWEWRTKGRVKQRRVKVELMERYDSYTPEDFINRVQAFNLIEARVELDDKYVAYGDDTVALYVSGWRVATRAEINEALAALDEQKQQQQEWKRRQIEALKKSDPDLFKEA